MLLKTKINHTLFFILSVFGVLKLNAQGSSGQNFISTPYSNYGIGEWTNTNFYQAGASQHTYSGFYSYSFLNPATLGDVRYTAFDASASLRTGYSQLGTEKYEFLGGGMEYLSLALPVWKKISQKLISYDSIKDVKRWKLTPWGATTAISIKPITSVGYSYYQDQNDTLKTRTSHKGSGGVNSLNWNTGFRLGNNFRVGYGLGYVFGVTKDNALFSVVDSLELGVVEDARTINVRGMQQQLGLMYTFKLDSTYHKFGASYEWFSNTHATRNRLTRSMEVTSAGYTSILDTILNEAGDKRSISLPSSFGLGYYFQYRKSWALSFDWRTQMWTNYSAFFDNNSYQNRADWGVTFHLNPEDVKRNNQKKMSVPVRLSFRQSNSQLQFPTNEDVWGVKEQRIGLGFGIPMVRRYYDNSVITNLIHIQAEYWTRTPTGGGLPNEQFFTIGVGFQLGDIWFARRKYD